jgi:hypothetical protein
VIVLPLAFTKPRATTRQPAQKTHFLGVRAEAVLDDQAAEAHISIEVRALKGIPNGIYRLAHQEGMTLGQYLSRIKLMATAVKASVYDRANPNQGRCRMSYVPQRGARILVCRGGTSDANMLQRSSVDVQRVASNMGRQPDGTYARFIDVKL